MIFGHSLTKDGQILAFGPSRRVLISNSLIDGTAWVDLVKSLGVDEVIDYRSEDFSARVEDVDLVLDTVGGDIQTKSFGVLRGRDNHFQSDVDPGRRPKPKHNLRAPQGLGSSSQIADTP